MSVDNIRIQHLTYQDMLCFDTLLDGALQRTIKLDTLLGCLQDISLSQPGPESLTGCDSYLTTNLRLKRLPGTAPIKSITEFQFQVQLDKSQISISTSTGSHGTEATSTKVEADSGDTPDGAKLEVASGQPEPLRGRPLERAQARTHTTRTFRTVVRNALRSTSSRRSLATGGTTSSLSQIIYTPGTTPTHTRSASNASVRSFRSGLSRASRVSRISTLSRKSGTAQVQYSNIQAMGSSVQVNGSE